MRALFKIIFFPITIVMVGMFAFAEMFGSLLVALSALLVGIKKR